MCHNLYNSKGHQAERDPKKSKIRVVFIDLSIYRSTIDKHYVFTASLFLGRNGNFAPLSGRCRFFPLHLAEIPNHFVGFILKWTVSSALRAPNLESRLAIQIGSHTSNSGPVAISDCELDLA